LRHLSAHQGRHSPRRADLRRVRWKP
jgi:hypothetical protein